VLTPNQFEAGLLTGLPVTTEQEALAAAEALHSLGPHTVVRGAGEERDGVVVG
jgi:pyridoxal/pyridoxine/pyridoxamine kinase